MYGCLVEVLMVDGTGQSDDSLVGETWKTCLEL